MKMTEELPAKDGRGQASADALSRVESKEGDVLGGSHALAMTTKAWSIYFLIRKDKSSVFGQNTGSTHIPTV